MSSGPDIVVHIHLHGDSNLPALLSALRPLSAQTPAVSTGAQAPPPPAPPADYVPGSPWGLGRLERFHRISWPAQHAIVTCIANASVNDTVATREQLLAVTTAETKQL